MRSSNYIWVRKQAMILILLIGSIAQPAWAEPEKSFNILVTNDDGISSEGIEALVSALRPLGKVTVAAPANNNSGIGQALTLLNKPLRVHHTVGSDGVNRYRVEGTPADCVVFGLQGPARTPHFDIVVSGINKGENVGKISFISGTVGAARQAVLMGVPAVAVSLQQTPTGDFDFGPAARFTASVVREIRNMGGDAPKLVSINVPNIVKGVQVVPAADSFILLRPLVEIGKPSKEVTDYRVEYAGITPPQDGTDAAVMDQGYIAVSYLGTSINAHSSEAVFTERVLAVPVK